MMHQAAGSICEAYEVSDIYLWDNLQRLCITEAPDRVARIIGVDSSIKNSALQKINFAFYTQITNNSLPTPIISRLQLFLPLGMVFIYLPCSR